jgi:hypothetical protein
MADKTIKSVWILGLSCLLLMQPIYGAEPEESDYAAFRKCGRSESPDERVANYKNFVKKHPTSDLADDAFLEIMKIMLEKNNTEKARATLAEIEKNHPQGLIHRQIYVGDADEEIVAGWKRFIQKNPISSSNWGKLLLARYLLQEGATGEAEALARYLLKNTRKPHIPKKVDDYRVLLTEDIRSDVLKLCAEIAKHDSDVQFLHEIQEIASEEYGAVPADLTASISLLEVQSLRRSSEDARRGQMTLVYILIPAAVGVCVGAAFLFLKKKASSRGRSRAT